MQSRPYREISVDLGWDSTGRDDGKIALRARGSWSSCEATTDFPDIGLLRTAGTVNPLVLDGPDNLELTEALLCPEMLRLLADERGRSGDRIRLRLTIPDDAAHARLRSVPWELCALGAWTESGFTGRPLKRLTMHPDVQIVRVVPAAGNPEAGTAATLAGRVLLATAYSVDGELGEETFRPLSQPGPSDADQAIYELTGTFLRPELVVPGPGRKSVSRHDLRQAIGAGPVAGFYFAGHHGDGGLVVSGPAPGGDGNPEWLPGDELAGMLLARGIQVVILMACGTGSVSSARARQIAEHRAFAERLVTAGVPWVVSAQGVMTNGASQRFAPAFWRWLNSGATVDEAACAGSEAMGDGAGLIVVHCAPHLRDPHVRQARTSGSLVLAYLSNAVGRPGRLVSPDVRWSLNRNRVRGIIGLGKSELSLVARLNRAEEVIRQGTFDFDRSLPHHRRHWYHVEAFEHPADLKELASGLGDRPHLWHSYLADAPEGAHLGFVIAWDPESEADVTGYLMALQGQLPEAATVVRVSGHEHARHAKRLWRQTADMRPDLLLLSTGEADERLDDMIHETGPGALDDAEVRTQYAEEPDTLALAALRNLRPGLVGWQTVESFVNRGVSVEVQMVADYLARRDDTEPSDLRFLCEAEPQVVDAAWRAGIRPGFEPSRLPEGAARMPGCWALLARSRLTSAIVRWLHEIGPPLASITGLLPDAGPDHGFEVWLASAREAYGLLRHGGPAARSLEVLPDAQRLVLLHRASVAATADRLAPADTERLARGTGRASTRVRRTPCGRHRRGRSLWAVAAAARARAGPDTAAGTLHAADTAGRCRLLRQRA